MTLPEELGDREPRNVQVVTRSLGEFMSKCMNGYFESRNNDGNKDWGSRNRDQRDSGNRTRNHAVDSSKRRCTLKSRARDDDREPQERAVAAEPKPKLLPSKPKSCFAVAKRLDMGKTERKGN